MNILDVFEHTKNRSPAFIIMIVGTNQYQGHVALWQEISSTTNESKVRTIIHLEIGKLTVMTTRRESTGATKEVAVVKEVISVNSPIYRDSLSRI